MIGRGHNENAVRLSMLADEAKRGLDRVATGEADAIEGWLAYGAALNEGRSLFPGDRQFGEWIAENSLSQLGQEEVHPKEQQAAMWAASNQDQFKDARSAGKARTVRGIHDKWKQIEAERERERREAERKADDERKRAEAEAARKIAKDKAKAEAEARAAVEAAKTEEARQEAEAKVVEAVEAKVEAEQMAADAEAEVVPAAESEDPDTAALRKEYRKLTPEAQEDDWIGLHLSLAEARKTIADQKTELAELKAWWAATSEGTDQKRGLAIADRQIRTTEGRMKEYQMIAKRATRRAEILEAENKRLRAEIENQVIPL